MNKIAVISKKDDNKYFSNRNYKSLTENNVIAMVPVRAGSNRVPNKNTRPFGNTSLLELKLMLLGRVKGIKQIIVSTDCEVSANMANSFGVKVQWRNEYFAGSNITNDQHWYHIADTTPGEIVFLAQVTSPLLRVSSMQNALNTFLNLETKDSLNSVSTEKKFLWQNEKPINYDINFTPKSQDLPNIVSLNFAITIIERHTMMKQKNVVGSNPTFFELDKVESMDIDDLNDFKVAELMYKELGKSWLMK